MAAKPPQSNVVPLDAPWRRHLRRGIAALRRGDHCGAADAFSVALQHAPEEPDALLAVGRELARCGRHAAAEPVLRRALALQPGSVVAAVLLARTLGLHLQRPEQAFAVVHAALARNPDAAPLQVVRGELLLEEGAISDARAAFATALDGDLADDAARVGLARTFNAEGIQLSEEGALERAIFCFKRAADLDPRWGGPQVNLGVAFSRLGNTEKAREAFVEALAREPDSPVAHFNLAATHQRLGRPQEAVALYEELLDLCPEYPQVRSSLANALGDLGDTDRAIALLLEELEVQGESVGAWYNLGLAYICSGNADRGEQCLRRALRLDPGHFNSYHTLATLYVAQARHDEAEATLRQAYSRHPEATIRAFADDSQFDAVRGLARFERFSREP